MPGMSPVIGRMAPSPTGRMHVGNVYAALAAWLAARSVCGKLRLRIEDLDVERVRPDADRWIMDDCSWLGLDWDDDVVYQSERMDCYDRELRRLSEMNVEEGIGGSESQPQPLVYPCFCSRADIKAASAPNEGDGFRVYGGRCRRLAASERERRIARGDRHSLRIAVPEDAAGRQVELAFRDRIYGMRRFNLAKDVGDTVIRRSDGEYAYQFAVSVDDLSMGVNQIVRGRDLLPSTAIQRWIMQQLRRSHGDLEDRSQVEYAHLPLILDSHGRRLAKRHEDMDIGALRAHGVRPQAVIGLCAYWLGIIDAPRPCSPEELIGLFPSERLRDRHDDIRLDARAFRILGL
ncbi:MAG: glutamate--tRNA ligase family protein [Bifidobacterium sp.]